MKRQRIRLALICTAAFAANANAVQLTEGFNDITTLAGSGWNLTNNSTAGGSSPNWFQGNTGVFNSQAGAADSYIAGNFNAASPAGGDISLWLITPQVTIDNGVSISFYTRTEPGSLFPDRLELRASTSGSSTNVGSTTTSVGDFTNLLLSVNPTLATGAYPEAWTLFTAVVSGVVGGPVNGRFAFRYFVTDTLANSDYIGIDTVSISDPGTPVPLPASAWLLLSGVMVLVLLRRRGLALSH
jgi:hypothetical protein